MRSIKTTVTAAAVLTAGLVLTAPAAHAATAAPQDGKGTCWSAISAAEKAKHDFNAAAADLKEQVAAGGHPGTAEEENLRDLMGKAKAAIATAEKVCKGDRDHGWDRDRDHRRHPRGAMRTGVGSTSQGVNGGELAGGVGISINRRYVVERASGVGSGRAEAVVVAGPLREMRDGVRRCAAAW
ncbi:hypothetical protein [Catenulispora rubra]|uniref:hypothetical protein n=1 Tax=Catenulispora rubra TaxID=280293 RepID=UPI0018923ED6|nr:hypothetical protein [Catenulispora rubra]